MSWLCMALLSPSDPRLKSDTGGGRNSGEAAMIAKDELFVYKGCGGLKKAKKERGCAAKVRISKLPPFAARKNSSIYRGITSSLSSQIFVFLAFYSSLICLCSC